MKTSEDYAELFDLVRESYGGKKFYCHFAGVEHRMGNALHYTQIKKSDLKFEPFAEYLAEEGEWLDITIISDSPLLEHDAMYMLQHYDKARQRLLEIRARDERQVKLARQAGMSDDELAEFERQAAEEKSKAAEKESESKEPAKKIAPKKADTSSMISFEDADDDDDIF
jgi:deoxyribonuclease-4